MDFVTIGKKIRKRRKALDITQESVADILNVNASHISNIECGRAHPSLSALVQIANILQCSVDCFIDGEYTYRRDVQDIPPIDKQVIEKLKLLDDETKLKICRIMDIL